MYGDGIGNTIINGNRHDTGELKNTSTFQVWGRRFIALHLTFQNTAGPEGGQAVAFLSGSDTSTVYRCSIEGYQDTLFTFNSRQFYKECQIYGTIDFIFGASETVFQDCDIFLRKPRLGGGLVVTANGRKHNNQTIGYSLQGCKIKAADDLKPVVDQYKKAFLGRPWFAYARTVYMQSFLDDLVDPQGWLDSWGYNQTTYCGEYKNLGPGSSTDQRVNWPGFQVITDPNIANQFTVAEFINGTQWLPTSGVPFVPGFENQ
ncbi:putative pectinesterase [Helianthus debilis subsp. tardiflorus]